MGAMAGREQDKVTQGTEVGAQTGLGADLDRMLRGMLPQLQDISSVYGVKDVKASRKANLDLAEMLKRMANGEFLPSGQDFLTARAQSQDLLAGQRMGMQNAFQNQMVQANRNAASMGRSTNDPILQAQLRNSQMQMQNELLGQETALTREIASSLPMQRLQYTSQRAGVLGDMADQASNLRMSLMGMGTNLQNLNNQMRIAGSTTTNLSGGGMKGMLTGGAAGMSMGMTGAAGGQALNSGNYGAILNQGNRGA